MLLGIPQIHGAARHVQHHHRLTHLHYRFHQLPLGLGQQQIRLVAGGVAVARISFLPLQGLVQPHAQEHHIAVLRHAHRLGDAVLP